MTEVELLEVWDGEKDRDDLQYCEKGEAEPGTAVGLRYRGFFFRDYIKQIADLIKESKEAGHCRYGILDYDAMQVRCIEPFFVLACVVIVYVIAWYVQTQYPRGEVATMSVSRFVCGCVLTIITLYAMFRRVTTAKKKVWCRWKRAGQQDTYTETAGKDKVETGDHKAFLR